MGCRWVRKTASLIWVVTTCGPSQDGCGLGDFPLVQVGRYSWAWSAVLQDWPNGLSRPSSRQRPTFRYWRSVVDVLQSIDEVRHGADRVWREPRQVGHHSAGVAVSRVSCWRELSLRCDGLMLCASGGRSVGSCPSRSGVPKRFSSGAPQS
jgi:hypothetical protein